MKKMISSLLIITFLSNMFALSFTPNVFASELTRPVTHGNEVVEVSVNNKGRFNIRTTETGNPFRPNDSRQTLLFNDDETSFTTFRINGEDYIFGENYAYSLSKKANIVGETVKVQDSILTRYQIGSGINVIQTLSIVQDSDDTNYGNVYIKYELENNTGASIDVGARILQDVAIGDNDGSAIKVRDNFYDTEIEFSGTDVPDVWRSTDNEFAPNVVGYGYTTGWGNLKPDKMIIGHWQGLSQTVYDYRVDNSLNFTIESDYGRKDTAVAYYWDPQPLSANGTINFEIIYGIGQIIGKELTYATNILAPTQMVVNAEQTGYLNNGEFEIAVMIENNLPNSEEIYDMMAYLTFEDGGGALRLDNDVALKGTKLVKKGGQYTFRWKMKATPGIDYNAVRYKVDLYDKRNLYQEGDELPGNAQVGDVKLDEIYSVSKALVLPSITGAPPKITFDAVSPSEIYFSGKNLVSVKTSGTAMLVEKSNWQLEYSNNGGGYQTVSSSNINVSRETDTLEIMFEQQFDPGEMDLRIRIINDIYTDGSESDNIVAGDIYKIPGKVIISKDKSVMQRTYGMLALVQDFNGDDALTLPIAVAGESELQQLEQAVGDANKKDNKERQILLKISGDIRAIRDNGELKRYVVYAQHKRAIINNLITYTSAIPLKIEYAPISGGRQTIDYSSAKDAGMSANFKNELDKTTILQNLFPEGSDNPGLPSDAEFDFTYVDIARDNITTITYGEALEWDELTSSPAGSLTVAGMGVLGINATGGFDFWMDVFALEFVDGTEYGLWDAENPVRIDLQGIGSVLNKVLDGMPVQIGGVRIAQDDVTGLDMLTFDATVNLQALLPGNVVVEADDIFFSTKGYEGMSINAEAAPDGKIGIVGDLRLKVGIDTFRDIYSIAGRAQVSIILAEVEFSIIKERRNNTWYLNDLVLAGGGKPGIPVVPGMVFIDKLGGGVRNLQQLTNPYYEDSGGTGDIFTVVLKAGMNLMYSLMEGHFTGQITKRSLAVAADEVLAVGIPVFKDIEKKIIWSTGDDSSFYISLKGDVDIYKALTGSVKITASDIFFEGQVRASVKIPDDVPVVGGKELARAALGINTEKVWGALRISLPWPLPTVGVGATYWWKGKFDFNIGEAGPFLGGPEGALYYGEFEDENGDTIQYIVGTNVKQLDGQIIDNSFKTMTPLTILEDRDGGYATFKPLNETVNEYIHEDESISLEDKYIYEIETLVNRDTKMVFEYGEGESAEGDAPDITLWAENPDQDNPNGAITITDTGYDLDYVDHVINNKNYRTFVGFTKAEGEDPEELTDVKLIVVSDIPLANYLEYTNAVNYGETDYEYNYQLNLENTSADTRLAFTHKGNFDIKVYKEGLLVSDGKPTIEEDTTLIKNTARFKDNNIIVYDNFPVGLSDATYYISSDQELNMENVLEARAINIPASTSEYGSLMAAEFVSEESIKDSEVFYLTDENGDVLEFFEWDPDPAELDEDYNNLFSEISRDGIKYSSMLYPFEEPGKYYVYSTVPINDEHTAIYEIENMPELKKGSVVVKENSQTSQKLDVYWDGSGYRYTENDYKGTGRTSFSFYLVKDDEIEILDDGQRDYEPGILLGHYEPREGDPEVYTVDIPRDTPTGDYRLMAVMGTEGLAQEYEYSSIIHYVNPHSPQKVSNVAAVPKGNGFLEVSWNNTETVEEYFIEVFDNDKKIINSFGTAFVDGNIKKAVIGGIYETFDPENPENSSVAGLETGKSYRVGITPVKKVDEALAIIGETSFSAPVFLPEPNPAAINIDFQDTETYTRTESLAGIDEDGNATYEDVEIPGVNTKAPTFKITSDQAVTMRVLLNKVELQNTNQYSDSLELRLNKLTEGINYLDVVAWNEDGDVSHESIMFYVDTRSPELLVDSPLSSQFIPEDEDSVLVKGRTEVGATVEVNGITFSVDDKGVFEGNVPVAGDTIKNMILIEASDDFGNVTANRIEVARNIAPIKGIVVTTDIPQIEQVVKKPVYEVVTESMLNVFTGQMEDVPMAKNDEPIGYDEEVLIENVVEMGRSYQINVQGITESAMSGNSDLVKIDQSKVNYEIIQGTSLAAIDEDGVLAVNNNGSITVKVSYELLGDSVDDHGNLVKGYAWEKYITMTSEYADIYGGETSPGSNPGSGSNSGSSGGDNSSVITPNRQSQTVNGRVIDSTTGNQVSEIKATVKTDNNGNSTVSMKAADIVVLKQPDRSTSRLTDVSKLAITTKSGTPVTISFDGTVEVQDLAKGTENNFDITYDLGEGQKITIGKMSIKVDSSGSVSLTTELIDPYGIITDADTGEAIDGVKVNLYYADTGRNKASGKTPGTLVPLPGIDGFKPNNNKNLQVSDAAGAYGFMVFPNADYYLAAEKEGYNKYTSPVISVEKEIVKWDFRMHAEGAERIFGQNRIDTALEIAKIMYANNISNVILVTADNYPDALTGSVLASKLNAPVLLVGSSEASQEKILSYLKDSMNPAGTVYILGGTGVVSGDMESKVAASGFKNIKRLGGKNRYETSVKIAGELGVEKGTPIIIASGENYPDALSISSTAAVKQYPVFLVTKDGIPDAVMKDILNINPDKVYIMGQQGAISPAVEDQLAQALAIEKTNIVRIGGTNRFETSLETAKYFNLPGDIICVATGNNFPDALAGSVYAAKNKAPIILVDKMLSEDAVTYFRNRDLSGAAIFGGEGAVSKYVKQQLNQLLGK